MKNALHFCFFTSSFVLVVSVVCCLVGQVLGAMRRKRQPVVCISYKVSSYTEFWILDKNY